MMRRSTTSGTQPRAAEYFWLGTGRAVFSLAIAAIGAETLICAHSVSDSAGFGVRYRVLPIIPWIPAIPWLAYLFGTVLIACAVGLLARRTRRAAALFLGGLLFLCALLLDLPKYLPSLGDMSLRTGVLETLSLAVLAWLLPEPGAIPDWLDGLSRYLLAIAMVVFGADHFLALKFIASLLPNWVPWHAFWVAFFGIAFIAGGVSIAVNVLVRWSAAALGLMFAIWVFTLHLPRVLGLYGIPGAPRDPNEWSSLFIAIGLWGGLWALAANE